MSPTIEDGGPENPPAFPSAIAVGPAGDVYHGFDGMTLLDYFAGQALVTLGVTNPNLPGDPAKAWPEPEVLAERRAAWAYLQARAMIAQRSKGRVGE